jgi:hypothetical protein
MGNGETVEGAARILAVVKQNRPGVNRPSNSFAPPAAPVKSEPPPEKVKKGPKMTLDYIKENAAWRLMD